MTGSEARSDVSERNYGELVDARNLDGFFLSAGLDPVWDRMHMDQEPSHTALVDFGKTVVSEVAPYAGAIKPNVEFWDAFVNEGGSEALTEVIEFANNEHPEVPTIIDAKQGDIGSTNVAALLKLFEIHRVDAITIHPWMGMNAMQHHLEREDKGFYVTVKTSNSGASDIQDMPVPEGIDVVSLYEDSDFRERYITEGISIMELADMAGLELEDVRLRPLWQMLLVKVTDLEGWNFNQNTGAVIGATKETEAEIVRSYAGEARILSPGLGAQGGSVIDMRNSSGAGVLYNSSSGIMLPSEEQVLELGGSGEVDKPGIASTIGVLALKTHQEIQSGLGLAA